jgi:hypothetical protein
LPFYIAAISPLRAFRYRTAYWIWQSVSLAAVLAFVYFWPGTPRWVTALACCWSAPLLECFIMGRDVAVILMVLALSWALFVHGRHFAAGCVLSLCLIKYNLFLPLPLLVAGKRLWRLGAGLVAGTALLLAISFAVGGWAWPLQYVAELRMPAATPNYWGMPNFHGLFSGLHSVFPEAAATCLALGSAWLVARGEQTERAVMAMLAAGLLVSYHAFFGDDTILIPVGLYLLTRATHMVSKLVGIVMLCPLTYLPFTSVHPWIPPAAVLVLPLAAVVGEEIRARRKAPMENGAAHAQIHGRYVTAG